MKLASLKRKRQACYLRSGLLVFSLRVCFWHRQDWYKPLTQGLPLCPPATQIMAKSS